MIASKADKAKYNKKIAYQSADRRFSMRTYRWRELMLFVIPFLIILLEMVQLLIVNGSPNLQTTFTPKILPTVHDLIPALGLIIVLLAVNVLLSFTFPKADQMLLPLAGLLSGLGMLMATRLGPDIGVPDLGTRQLVWVVIGIIACMVVLFILRKMSWLRRYKYTWAFLGILMVGFTLVNALRTKNLDSPTHDQLNFGPLNLQPSELLKIFLVIFFAAYLSENFDILSQGNLRLGRLRLPPLAQLGPIAFMLGIALLLFLGIRELGLALLIYGIFLCMIYLGTQKIAYVVVSLLIFAILGFIGYKLFSYVQLRFQAVTFDVVNWQNWGPTQTSFAENQGLQIVQGLIALSTGGIIGTGLGLGHPAYVPVIQSDMVFTAFGEEMGLAGLFAILGIYLLLIYRGYRIAIEATDPFTQLLAAGLTSIFAIQTFIIAAANMKFLPLTGIPLPFLSYGGSSVIANYMIIGILLRISHNTAVERDAT